MSNAPSAVNIGRVPMAVTPDNSRQMQQFASVGRQLVGQAMENSKKKKASALANDLMEDPKAASQRLAVDAQEQEQIEAVQQKAEAERKEVAKVSNMKRILSSPDDKAKLLQLMQMDQKMGQSVLDIMSMEDAQQKAAFASQMQETNRTFENAGVILKTQGKEGLDEYLMEVARPIYQDGGDVSKLLELKQMDADQAAAQIERNRAMTGTILQMPEVQKNVILSDGAELRDAQGNLLARNEKDIAPTDAANVQARVRGNELRAEELQMQRDKIPAGVEKTIVKAQELAFESRNSAGEMESIAQAFDGVDSSGQSAKWTESFKKFSGSEDAVSGLRMRFNRVKNAQVMKALPPGAASDVDVKEAKKGFPSETASPQQVASFLRGAAKIETMNADFQEYRAQYMSDNKTAAGLTKAWKNHSKDKYAPEPSKPQAGQSAATVNANQLRQEAAQAIANGAPREAVEARLQQMLNGG